MAKIDAVLNAWKSAFQNAATTFTGGVYIRPDDTGSLNVSRLPLVLIAQDIGTPSKVAVLSLGGGVNFGINILIDVLVHKGTITDDRTAKEAEQAHRLWFDNTLEVITDPQNRTLGGLITGYGDAGITVQTGHVALGTNTFWGLRFTIPTNVKGR